MMHSEIEIVSRVKISGDNQPKNLASLTQQGYDIYFIESTTESESGGGHESYFYYEACRDEECLHAITPIALLKLATQTAAESKQ